MYCEKDHKHGVLPCHMNRDYVFELAGLLTKEICLKEDVSKQT